ncbi:MAG: DUF4198 domain-containing protein [Planctomycetales bacterium]|nr:DUF4198 domain-containing protein [Planctomycetales bacterium]
MNFVKLLCGLFLVFVGPLAHGHDTWVEAGPLSTRQGEYVYVNLMLGNHGNDHRDFKLASKITLAPCTLSVTAPSGTSRDLKPAIIDMGSAPKEGYWAARFVANEAGIYEAVHTLDILHGPTRAVKSAKTYFVAEGKNGQAQPLHSGFPPVHGHGLELVLASELPQLAAGRELKLRVLRNAKPLEGARVVFVPRGVSLSSGEDPNYERTSDAAGYVAFTPAEGNVLLAVAHHVAADETGEGYDKTHYAATLVLPVPNRPLR